MGSKKVIEVCDCLQSYMGSLAAKGLVPPTSELIPAFQKEYAKVIALSAKDLEYIALSKLVNQVASRRKRSATSPEQPDLLAGLGLPALVPLASGERKIPEYLTLEEASDWVRGGVRLSRVRKLSAFEREIKDLSRYAKPTETVEKALKLRQIAQEEAAKNLELNPA